MRRLLRQLGRRFGLSSLFRNTARARHARLSAMAAAHIDSSLSDTVSALLRHFNDVVLPLWLGRGFDRSLNLPREAVPVAAGMPVASPRYRAMACARQLYVYAQQSAPACGAHADLLFASLQHHFRDERHGGWRYSIDAAGQPLDARQDLYTHAFIVFACAAYFRRSRNAAARQLLLSTVHTIEARFAMADGLYCAAMAPDWSAVLQGPLQNPMMHLTEAYLAAAQVAEPAWFAQALRKIAQAVTRTFVHTGTQCVAELPIGVPNNRLEPGHQFEWFSLLGGAAEVFAGLELAETIKQAYAWARRKGVMADTGGVCAALDQTGAIIDPVQRIWAQTEYARALAVAGDHRELARILVQLRRRFLHPAGWYECLGPAGELARQDMPSTSPYHLATCYAALPGGLDLR